MFPRRAAACAEVGMEMTIRNVRRRWRACIPWAVESGGLDLEVLSLVGRQRWALRLSKLRNSKLEVRLLAALVQGAIRNMCSQLINTCAPV